MTNILIYIVQVTGVFSLLFIVYKIALSRLTFHTINRYLLLSLIPISFLLPLIDGLFPSISKVIIDIIIIEVFIALFWFNPSVYFYRKSLKSVHEFQADNRVLNKQIKTSLYLQVLLQNLVIKNHL